MFPLHFDPLHFALQPVIHSGLCSSSFLTDIHLEKVMVTFLAIQIGNGFESVILGQIRGFNFPSMMFDSDW